MLLVTHSGKFHLDEVMATAVLLKIHPGAQIARTRSREEIACGDIVYDVGRVCDPSANRFDHHHAEFAETFSPRHKVRLSSAGLVYKYHGKRFLETYDVDPQDECFQRVFEEVYECYFLSADAIDNGYEIFGEIVPRSLSHVVESFNSQNLADEQEQGARFLEAVRLVETDMDNFMNTMVRGWIPNYKLLDGLVRKHEGDILCVDTHCFVDIIPELENKHGKDIKFVLNTAGGSVRILAVPRRKSHFESKVPLKTEWRGLAGKHLEAVSNIEGSRFVHISGFVGLSRTVEGAIEMCRASIDAHAENEASQ